MLHIFLFTENFALVEFFGICIMELCDRLEEQIPILSESFSRSLAYSIHF